MDALICTNDTRVLQVFLNSFRPRFHQNQVCIWMSYPLNCEKVSFGALYILCFRFCCLCSGFIDDKVHVHFTLTLRSSRLRLSSLSSALQFSQYGSLVLALTRLWHRVARIVRSDKWRPSTNHRRRLSSSWPSRELQKISLCIPIAPGELSRTSIWLVNISTMLIWEEFLRQCCPVADTTCSTQFRCYSSFRQDCKFTIDTANTKTLMIGVQCCIRRIIDANIHVMFGYCRLLSW